MIKKISSVMIVLLLFSSSLVVFSDDVTDKVDITFEKALKLAIENDRNSKKLQDAIDDLWDSHNVALEAKNQIQEYLDTLDAFKKLYDKKYVDKETLNPVESLTLAGYQMAFGDEPPEYTAQEMLDKYIKNRDFPHYAAWTAIQKLKNQKASIPISYETNIRNLYMQDLNLRGLIKAKEGYLEANGDKFESDMLKYDKGLISEDEYIKSKYNLEILKLELDIDRRNLETLEMNIKKILGIDLTTEINLTTDMLSLPSQTFSSYEEYLEEAFKNRDEVVNANLDLNQRLREENIIKEYLKNELLTDRINARLNVLEAENMVRLAKEEVEQDIYTGFIEVINFKEDYLNKRELYMTEMNNLKNSKLMLDRGLITKTDYDMLTYKYDMLEVSFKAAVRSYYDAVKRLENAVKKHGSKYVQEVMY